MVTSVVVVRHGETEWSRDGRHTGWTDLTLTERGRAAVGAVTGALGDRQFVRVLVSPLRRARETAELAGFAEVATIRDDLHEWDYGDYEGRTTPEVREEQPGWTVWADGAPGGEQPDDVGRRADRVLAELAGVEGDALLFAHGHLLRVLAARWLGLPADHGRLLALSAGTISELGHEHETPVILRWNESC